MGSVVVMMGTWVSCVGSNWNSGQEVTSMPLSEVAVVVGRVAASKQSKEKSKLLVVQNKEESKLKADDIDRQSGERDRLSDGGARSSCPVKELSGTRCC